jgi:hypothetical protein
MREVHVSPTDDAVLEQLERIVSALDEAADEAPHETKAAPTSESAPEPSTLLPSPPLAA